ncbi:serine/threonine protein kinase [Labrenzia sp. 011]|uniref:serine/threonine protein kinase n=1 Tax=Labrenzia sp. 011 TaxID=2171494 RepID=UPI000D5174FB|nr:serine/threonine protein kinase [Labrenzia sp. 011]PVB61361.1 serine/threonine protein kinase [Labrenzia sp. 011]
MRLIVLAAGFLLLSAVASLAQQRVYCPLPEDGIWVNKDAAPKQISRVEVESRCLDDQVHVRVRAFTACIPRDCKWGWTQAERRSDGAIQVLLIGFLSSKQLTLKVFGDMLDVHVISIVNDLSEPRREETFNLTRK